MAVTTWTAGQVLAAADLNDTFASKLPYSYGTATPSTTDSGFLWYDSNSTPPVPKYWNGSSFANLVTESGLILITSATASAVSSISIDNCFSGSYVRYFVIANMSGSGGSLRMRWRASSSDNTSTVYYTAFAGALSTGGDSNSSAAAQDSHFLGLLSTNQVRFSMDVHTPATAEPTAATITTQDWQSGNLRGNAGAQLHTGSNAFDGMTLYATSGTISGVVRIYGYEQ